MNAGFVKRRNARRAQKIARISADGANEWVCADSVVSAPARPVVAPYGVGATDDSQGTTTRRAVREAADGADEWVCADLVVPRLPRRADALLAMTNGGGRSCHCEGATRPWQSQIQSVRLAHTCSARHP